MSLRRPVWRECAEGRPAPVAAQGQGVPALRQVARGDSEAHTVTSPILPHPASSPRPLTPRRPFISRLKAYRKWLTMEEPRWSDNRYPAIDYQDLSYYSAPRVKDTKASLDEVDPELLKTFEKLGIPLNEQKRLANVAVDAVFDSVSIATTFREELGRAGVIFSPSPRPSRSTRSW